MTGMSLIIRDRWRPVERRGMKQDQEMTQAETDTLMNNDLKIGLFIIK